MRLTTTRGAGGGALGAPLVVVAVAQDDGGPAGEEASAGAEGGSGGGEGEAAGASAPIGAAERAAGEALRAAWAAEGETVARARQRWEGDETTGASVPSADAAADRARPRWEEAMRCLRAAWAAGDFSGKEGETVLAYVGGRRRVLFCGVGRRGALSAERMRELGGRAARAADKARAASLAVVADHVTGGGEEDDAALWQGLAEGLGLAAWRFDELATVPEGVEPPPLVGDACLVGAERTRGGAEAARAGREFAEAENLARTLQARPGNLLTPAALAEAAARVADDAGLACRVLGRRELEDERMGGLLAVAQGSNKDPRLIVLRHAGGSADDPPLVLVGKGLTFDAGGISIKPAKGMEEMKYDMSGGAAVLGAMRAIGRLEFPVNVVGVVPSSENLLGGSAVKPGDVVTTRAGVTVEVINTDAEGRLILADALDYARQWRPAAVVDCATLTGACVVALGSHRSGLLGNDEALLRELAEAGDAAGQRVWRLPLDEPYRQQLDSEVADLKNVGGREAGTITAAWFLAEFAGDVPWAHLDVAGTAYGKTKKPYLKDGPRGTPCRLLLEWVRRRAGAWAGRACALAALAAAPAAAQDPPAGQQAPPDSLPDSVPADSAAAAQADSAAAADSIPPPPVLPLLDDIGPAAGAPGVWEWDQAALLAARGQTLLELLSQAPGVLPLRGGDFGAAATAVPVGLAGGGLRLYYDGVEHLPLDGAVPDLSRVALSGVQRVRAVRRASGLEVHLSRLVHSDVRPYALIEAGTGDLDTNVLRATFSYPRVARGKAALALERIDTRGPEDAGAVTGGWLRYSLHRGDRAGLRFEYRRVAAERSVPADAPGVGAQRSDWTVQGVWAPAEGLLAEAWATGAALAPSAESPGDAGARRASRRQYGGRVAGGTERLWGRAALRVNDGAGVPEHETAVDVSAAHPRWGGASLHGWRESWSGDAGAGYDARAWAAPVSFLTLFAEVGDGRRSAAAREPAGPPDDSAAGPRFFERSRSRYGVEGARWGVALSAARLSVEADSVRPTQLPFDRGGLVAAQPRHSAWEFSARVPLRPRGLHLRAQVQLWNRPSAAPPGDRPAPADSVPSDSLPSSPLPALYLPDHLYDAALSFHRTFLPTENFELWVDLGARGRAGMAVPVPRTPEAGEDEEPAPSVVPFYQDWYLRVQMRFLSLNVFIMVENLTLREANQDVPGRVLPGTRGIYGVRWTLWN